ncbi:MAG: phosphate regulon sensor histidine kinase PhoR [Polynucleobacter sp.]|nr:phosphate regulon sensor histidine kinase PhoR [Polynucleobacter sp.]
MFAAITRFTLILAFAVLLYGLTHSILGGWLAYGISLSILALPLAYFYIQSAILKKYLQADEIENLPPAFGYLEDVFFRLQRTARTTKQRIVEVERQHQRFIEAFQASPNGIVMLDNQDQIEWCNSIAERFFGLSFKRDALQRINYILRNPEFVQYLSSRRFEEPLLIEKMGPGSNMSLLLQIFPFAENHRLLLAQDVTDLRKAEAMRRDFVANVSHEMRTPLTVMMGFLETVQSLDLEPQQEKEYLELMMLQGHRMKSLVEDLLILANLESNALPALTNQIAVSGSVFAYLRGDAEALSQGRHTFHFECNASVGLLGDEQEILSAFGNLISNAIRYTPDGGEIRVLWDRNAKGQGVFSVRDTGPGISAEHLPRLTERFYRVDRSRSRDTGGTGLGLAIVKHIASRHQAQLQIESSVGIGSQFSLVFPVERNAQVIPSGQ